MSAPEATGDLILDLPMRQPNDAEAETIRQYLIALLHALWEEDEMFSGKRALGNSDWPWQLFEPLATARLIEAQWDEDGNLEDCDADAGTRLIHEAIRALGVPS